jgi:hypothetical protein
LKTKKPRLDFTSRKRERFNNSHRRAKNASRIQIQNATGSF